ncbi:MAG TPA: alpha/beta fold hydrolase [Chloroflexia bacterium]|nr:alpha/beta fold hydrolase [Chloroflexia bacterium]
MALLPRTTSRARYSARAPGWYRYGRALRRILLICASVVLLIWLGYPSMMVYLTLHPARHPSQTDPRSLPFPVEPVAFPAVDGVTVRGWFGRAAADAPVILLGHGYPANRDQMIPEAAFLYAAGYSVLLFDWRGWGASDGGMTTFGVHEVDDLSGAMNYLQARPDLRHPRFGGLGVSMGAGLMLLGAAHDHRLAAVVCDSTYERIAPMFGQWGGLGLTIWPYHLTFPPLAEPTANLLLDGRLADLDPLRQAAAVSPSALLLVHAAQDHNGLTPLAGAQRIYAAARAPKALWISPRGDHATIYAANPVEYQQQVLRFLATYLPAQGGAPR